MKRNKNNVKNKDNVHKKLNMEFFNILFLFKRETLREVFKDHYSFVDSNGHES